jgi:hypothetical protein
VEQQPVVKEIMVELLLVQEQGDSEQVAVAVELGLLVEMAAPRLVEMVGLVPLVQSQAQALQELAVAVELVRMMVLAVLAVAVQLAVFQEQPTLVAVAVQYVLEAPLVQVALEL